MKIQLTPNDLKAILANHPETEVSLVASASKQVADAIARKEFKTQADELETRLLQTVSEILVESPRRIYGSNRLTGQGRELVEAAIRVHLQEASQKEVMQTARKHVQTYVETCVDKIADRVMEACEERMEAAVRKALANVLTNAG